MAGYAGMTRRDKADKKTKPGMTNRQETQR